MSDKRRRTVTTIETHEVWTISRPASVSAQISCPACPGDLAMLTPQEAAQQAGVSRFTVYRWAEEGRIHFAETTEGNLFVCLAPLTIDVG